MIFGWSLSDFGDLQDQYVAMPVPAAPGVPADKVVWDGSSNQYEDSKLAISASCKNMDAALKVANLLYSEKYSIQQFLGSFGDILTKTGDHTYTVDSDGYRTKLSDNLFPGLSDRFAGWIPDDVTITGDYNADDILEVNKAFDEQRSHYDHVKDYMPDYVRADATDSTTISNNNTQLMDAAVQQAATWMTEGGTTRAGTPTSPRSRASGSTRTSNCGRSGTTSTPSSAVPRDHCPVSGIGAAACADICGGRA